MPTIAEKLDDLHKQATTERSHYYVGSLCQEAAAVIRAMEAALDHTLPVLEAVQRMMAPQAKSIGMVTGGPLDAEIRAALAKARQP